MTTAFCAAPAIPGLATRLLADTDCQAFGLVERGYAALAQPGGPVATALTGLLVIAVALFGYRLLLGRGLMLSDAVSLAIKIGIVLLISTSWESWQTLAYDSLARAPVRIAGDLLGGIGARDPLVSLQATLDGLEAASQGYRAKAGVVSPLVGGPASAAMTLNVAAFIVTISTVGLMIAARVLLSLLLAIAPVMAGFILFDPTRGMAEGWLGAMIAAALTPLFVLVLAAIEFAITGPLIVRVLTEQAAGRFEDASVTPIGLVTIVFAIAMFAALRAGGRIARGLRLPRGRAAPRSVETVVIDQAARAEPVVLAQSSAARVTQALESIARRDDRAGSAASRQIAAALTNSVSRESRVSTVTTGTAYTAAARRTPLPPARRRSRAATRRDG